MRRSPSATLSGSRPFTTISTRSPSSASIVCSSFGSVESVAETSNASGSLSGRA